MSVVWAKPLLDILNTVHTSLPLSLLSVCTLTETHMQVMLTRVAWLKSHDTEKSCLPSALHFTTLDATLDGTSGFELQCLHDGVYTSVFT